MEFEGDDLKNRIKSANSGRPLNLEYDVILIFRPQSWSPSSHSHSYWYWNGSNSECSATVRLCVVLQVDRIAGWWAQYRPAMNTDLGNRLITRTVNSSKSHYYDKAVVQFGMSPERPQEYVTFSLRCGPSILSEVLLQFSGLGRAPGTGTIAIFQIRISPGPWYT